eukprot:10623024-Alexandrium_andersonii.AAC.1
MLRSTPKSAGPPAGDMGQRPCKRRMGALQAPPAPGGCAGASIGVPVRCTVAITCATMVVRAGVVPRARGVLRRHRLGGPAPAPLADGTVAP